ncbi:MAG: Mrp/NBP35 family ATP-binding protein [Firmicutes bacterium]|nr:Mrp/NBP35 family ATP-binding protein [Bacillota bacterium]
MSENCDHNCSTCKENCEQKSFQIAGNEKSAVKRVIGVVSGKGGVGKSLVTSLLACAVQKRGLSAAILDADITGPSIPRMFGVSGQPDLALDGDGLLPKESGSGVRIMSTSLLLEHEDDPVVFRGPVIANTVKQFWTDVVWGQVDVMLVDMPPGTGDVPLTVFQSLPVDGIIVVTSPQELVGKIVGKAVNMARMMNIPVLGLVENMSYFQCPDCGARHEIFGASHLDDIAARYDIKGKARLPIDPQLAALCDSGKIEDYQGLPLEELARVALGK